MSEQTSGTSSPLQQAQQLLAELQKAAAPDPDDLKSKLAAVDTLLKEAAARGEGADATALRTELNETIDRNASFTSMMVHEIRKPMTSIRGYADMLSKPDLIGPMNEQQQQFIDIIRTNTIRMEGLVTDISDIGKLTAKRIKLDNKMTTSGQIFMEVQKLAEPLIAETGQTVTWDVPQGLPILNVDSKQLAKVIWNLVKNAIQYTPKGGTISVKAERLDGNVLHILVTDSGIGMEPEEIARPAELFYRADHELVTSQKGYGLGIPVAKGLLALMDSELNVASTPDHGSIFSFSIVGMG